MFSSTRSPAVAGLFYPADPVELTKQLKSYLAKVGTQQDLSSKRPKAIIVPHAGYIYSGEVAAHAFASIGANANKIKRVVLIGPAHTIYLQGCALPEMTHFETPLGFLDIDKHSINSLSSYEGVTTSDLPHQNEHSLEVQLPFLQHLISEFTLIPIVVGDIMPNIMADILQRVWGGDETLIVVSTDLSHFHQYEEALYIDSKTCQKVLALSCDISSEQACGCRALNAIALQARRHNLNITQLSYRNSGDTSAGDKERVVGYASFVID
ncbi:AmmeMemoRadiSam system protein B [Shewanella sp. UCD-KL12]|uniref:AmmeMemoRadiSam system protein B n=1 Tax=Shewanella sp. UCD-KL12 TaxID=1917163 RepID=UPI000970ECA5|nr:AmmeMemoRadiSam system protein B [Shewanella sp. UCD-KL12]